MTCSEIIQELTKLKKRIEFLNERKNNNGKVLKKIYTKKNTELFFEGGRNFLCPPLILVVAFLICRGKVNGYNNLMYSDNALNWLSVL